MATQSDRTGPLPEGDMKLVGSFQRDDLRLFKIDPAHVVGGSYVDL